MKATISYLLTLLLCLQLSLSGASVKEAFGTSNQSIAVTASATLVINGQASSAAVDNSSNLYTDALVTVKVTTAASGTTSVGVVNVYAAGTTDGGTKYGGGETNMCTDATVTLTSPPNISLIGVINTPANSTTYYKSGMSVASAFGGPGSLPDHWCLVLENKTNATAATATLTAATANYQGVYATVASIQWNLIQPRLLTRSRREAQA